LVEAKAQTTYKKEAIVQAMAIGLLSRPSFVRQIFFRIFRPMFVMKK
jgi:hypothetical protein